MQGEARQVREIEAKLKELSGCGQRAYHLRERLDSMLGRINGEQVRNESSNAIEEKPVEVPYSHMSELQKGINRLNEELSHIDHLVAQLEEFI